MEHIQTTTTVNAGQLSWKIFRNYYSYLWSLGEDMEEKKVTFIWCLAVNTVNI